MLMQVTGVVSARRQEQITKRAYELAASGVHISPITVVTALVEQGFPEAADILNNDLLRTDLRQVCAVSWKGARPEDAATEPGYSDDEDRVGMAGSRGPHA